MDSYARSAASWESGRERACAEAGFGVDDPPDDDSPERRCRHGVPFWYECERCDDEDDPWRDDGGEAA